MGPLLFVAKAYYGNEDLSTMDTVATAFIILILIVFDPMAIALLLAAQTTIRKVQAETTGDGWGGGDDESGGESRTIPYMPDVDETLPDEEVEPPRVSKDHESPVVSITTEDLATGVRIGVPAQHAYKSGTAHATEANDDSESADTETDELILPTDTDTDTLANRNLDDTIFTPDRPKSGKRRTRYVAKN